MNCLIDIEIFIFHRLVKMKPSRPRVLNSSRNYITIGWDSCDSLILKPIQGINEESELISDDRRWYLLERKDKILGWMNEYAYEFNISLI